MDKIEAIGAALHQQRMAEERDKQYCDGNGYCVKGMPTGLSPDPASVDAVKKIIITMFVDAVQDDVDVGTRADIAANAIVALSNPKSSPSPRITPEMIASLGGKDQIRSFLAALFIVQAELEQEVPSPSPDHAGLIDWHKITAFARQYEIGHPFSDGTRQTLGDALADGLNCDPDDDCGCFSYEATRELLKAVYAKFPAALSTPLDREAIIRECAAVAEKFADSYKAKFLATKSTLSQGSFQTAEGIECAILALIEQET